jgi:hypothetical protein
VSVAVGGTFVGVGVGVDVCALVVVAGASAAVFVAVGGTAVFVAIGGAFVGVGVATTLIKLSAVPVSVEEGVADGVADGVSVLVAAGGADGTFCACWSPTSGGGGKITPAFTSTTAASSVSRRVGIGATFGIHRCLRRTPAFINASTAHVSPSVSVGVNLWVGVAVSVSVGVAAETARALGKAIRNNTAAAAKRENRDIVGIPRPRVRRPMIRLCTRILRESDAKCKRGGRLRGGSRV